MSLILTEVVADPLEAIPTLPAEPVTREEVLLTAADIIERHGWVAGANGTPDVGFCMVGAVAHAAASLGRPMEWVHREAPALLGAHSYEHVYRWNDPLRFERRGILPWRRKPKPAVRVATALREIAAGASFTEATA